MRRSLFGSIIIIPLAVLFFVAVPGCPKKDTGKVTKKEKETKGSKAPDPIKNYDAKILGEVVLVGTAPELKPIPIKEKDKDFKGCMDPKARDFEKKEQTYILDGNKLAGVAVWLVPPDNKFFYPDEKDRKRSDVELRQPHCAFIPQVLVLNPVYFDGKDNQKTGQKLKILNDAVGIGHNTKLTAGGNLLFNETLQPGKEPKTVEIDLQDDPIQVSCDVHTWMKGRILTFDHPYAAVSSSDDKDFGKFAIDRVPADVEVSVVAWHPVAGYIWGKEGKKMTFKKGDNPLKVEVKESK